jgi:Poxvirus Late Transcription Factor VLTF3 like
MDAEIADRLKTFESDVDRVNYLLDCVPFIRELYTDKSEQSEPVHVFSGITHVGGVRKGDIYKRFMKKVYENSENTEHIDVYKCKYCCSSNIIYVINSSEQVCDACGAMEIVNREDDIGYKEEQDLERTMIYSYKRENHFNEWMCQFQAKESTSVPQTIIDEIKDELKKQKISAKVEITHTKIKEILKKLGYNKYYEHTPYITTMVNGIKPPTMDAKLEEQMRVMFYQIQAPFDKFCPKDRINFLSYSYVLYKFCELLGEDTYLPCFPLLKSKDKLYKHDQIWKKITAELRWEYIATI